jgi:hypothetical protein
MTNDTYGDLYLIADELRTIANYGLMHQKNEYDRERLYQVLSTSARMIGILEKASPDDVIAAGCEAIYDLGIPRGTKGRDACATIWRTG